MSEDRIFRIIEEERIRFINLQFTDLHGIPKAVSIPVNQLRKALNENVWFDGSSIEGFTRIYESDMYLKLNPDTFAVLPWTRDEDYPTARIICDVYLPDGRPFPAAPRNVLKRQLKKLADAGYTFNVGPELEFFLLKKNNGKIELLPHDKAGYFDWSTDRGIPIRKEITDALEQMGIEVEAVHHEVAPGQHEIDFHYGDALTVADRAMTFKFVVKAIAHRHGLHATFMPKPLVGINGSGMHTHQSVFKDGQNVFFDEKGLFNLSDTARHWIAGLLTHARAMTAVLNPTVNSYKRLVRGYEAPVYVCWASRNRSALVRVPRFTVGKGQSARCELRSPDPASNPYLAFAVMAAAGWDGMQRKLEPPEPDEELNIFELSDEALKAKSMEVLPASLREALRELEEDEVIRGSLGEELFSRYYFAKMREWEEYTMYVTQWELDTYLEIL